MTPSTLQSSPVLARRFPGDALHATPQSLARSSNAAECRVSPALSHSPAAVRDPAPQWAHSQTAAATTAPAHLPPGPAPQPTADARASAAILQMRGQSPRPPSPARATASAVASRAAVPSICQDQTSTQNYNNHHPYLVPYHYIDQQSQQDHIQRQQDRQQRTRHSQALLQCACALFGRLSRGARGVYLL